MPSSVQKILFHGSLVISAALLPISQMFKEAQEARNKDLKNIRENYSRKCSRIVTNEDLLHGLLVSSDPVIFSLRKLPLKKISSFSQEVLQLLKKIVQVQVMKINRYIYCIFLYSVLIIYSVFYFKL